eukprot:2004068-Rhodomonas_salina.4
MSGTDLAYVGMAREWAVYGDSDVSLTTFCYAMCGRFGQMSGTEMAYGGQRSMWSHAALRFVYGCQSSTWSNERY